MKVDASAENRVGKVQIVREALALLNEEGIEKLSMRKLAARLEIRAPTIYWYFPDRSSILREIVRTLLHESIAHVPACSTWQDWLKGLGASLWRTNRDVPYATLLLQSAELNDESVVNLAIDLVEHQRQRFTVDRDIFHRAHGDLQAFVLGWAVFHHSRVTSILHGFIEVEEAVSDGIDGIVSVWDARQRSRDAQTSVPPSPAA